MCKSFQLSSLRKEVAVGQEVVVKLNNEEFDKSFEYDCETKMMRQNSKDKEKQGDFPQFLVDAVTTIILSNPLHTSTVMAGNLVRELFHKQGHSRLVNSIYTPDTPLIGEDVDEDYGDDESGRFNKEFTQDAREHIARFVEYLATRDLSKDSEVSKKRKQRQLPALIILLFSSGLYDLILNCPTMPDEYAHQITKAFNTITQSKYDVVEELAQAYEDANRPGVAARVRKLQLAWFAREPANIRTAAELSDLELTFDDVMIYKKYRSKFTNTSKAITQEVISDLIEVVEDKEEGIYKKLKDKTRGDAINDVKKVYQEWSKDNPIDSDLARKIIWREN